MNFTVVIVIDREHLDELEMTIPTWRKYKPELWRSPWLVIYDRESLSEMAVCSQFALSGLVPSVQVWPPRKERFNSHWDKMASARYYGCRYVTTPWWLKLDVDTVAYKSANWVPVPSEDSVMVGHRTRSRVSISLRAIDRWARRLPEFKDRPPCEFFKRYRKLHGFCTFHRTDWTQRMVSIAERHCGPLGMPLPSDDAYFMFCAHRFEEKYEWMNVRNTGWLHPRRGRPLDEMVERAMA